MFENKQFEGIYYSRFIASWTKKTQINPSYLIFKDWLRSLTINGRKMDEDVINEIYNLATNGKLELEKSAWDFADKRFE